MRDSKITKLELSWEDNQPVIVSVESRAGAVPSGRLHPRAPDESGALRLLHPGPAGGSFKYNIISAAPAVAPVVGGKITIAQDIEYAGLTAGVIEPGDAIEGNLAVSVELDVIPTDATLWRKILTGSASGTAIQTTPQYGSFEVAFAKSPDSLKFAGSNVAFLADLPGADAKGGSGRMSLVGKCYPAAANGTPITATLMNTVASY